MNIKLHINLNQNKYTAWSHATNIANGSVDIDDVNIFSLVILFATKLCINFDLNCLHQLLDNNKCVCVLFGNFSWKLVAVFAAISN